MKILSIILFLSVSLQWTAARVVVKRSTEYTNWRNLKFSKGDVIHCKLFLLADHVLLATSNWQVAHMVGDKTSGEGSLREESWEDYHNREGSAQSNCAVDDTAKVNNRDFAVERAREDIAIFSGQKIYYDLLDCNCEHWVNNWASGRPYSFQSYLANIFRDLAGEDVVPNGLAIDRCDVNDYTAKRYYLSQNLKARERRRMWDAIQLMYPVFE